MTKFQLGKNSAVLVIVDIQEKLAAVMEDGKTTTANCILLIEAAKLLDLPIVLTEQYPKGLGSTLKQIQDALPSYEPIEKITFDCCKSGDFLEKIRALGRKHVIITGMESHVCVLQTCLTLLDEGYYIHLASNAVCSRRSKDHMTALEMMRDAGAVISSAETVVFQLLERAGTKEFNEMARKIK